MVEKKDQKVLEAEAAAKAKADAEAAEAEKAKADAEAKAKADAEAAAAKADAKAANDGKVLFAPTKSYDFYDPYQKVTFPAGGSALAKPTKWLDAQVKAGLLKRM